MPAPPDPEATQLLFSPDPEATRLGTPSDADAAGAGMPQDPEATRLGTAVPHDPEATTLDNTAGPTTRARTGFGSTGATRAPKSYGDAASDLVGQPLGNRYQIIRLLGAGGMGAVYQAWDQDLSVVVALKTVRPEVASDPEAARVLERRFKQELLLARKVTHKNIVRVHDMGDVDGIKYITMPYLEGDDLSTILKKEGKLPVDRVMPIARQVASGLAAAHAAGVVHRDLKPANIMMQADGEALIMDFGVARSTHGQAEAPAGGLSAPAHGHTMVGSVVGTLEYMAPEQAKAQPVDQRSDIYAFGLILYDLLLGRSRGKGSAEGVFAELQERMKQAPASPITKDATIPAALDEIITRCIQPDASARFQTTADLVGALDRLDDQGVPIPIVRRLTRKMVAAAVLVIASLVGFTWWAAKGPAVEAEHEPVSVLIADFQNATGDATFDRTLEPVMQIALETAGFISAFDRAGIRRTLDVRPPEKLDEQAALELAVKQGINVVLSGTVAQSGNRYDVSVKAIQAVTGTVMATESERASDRNDVLGAATRLAASVRGALGDTTSDSAKRFAMEKLSAKSLDAVREYARGIEALSQSKFQEAFDGFSKAVALDPEFGTAYGGMAISARNLDRPQDALKYANQAMTHVGGMTDRERQRARGLFYYLTDDYVNCVKEYGLLLASYSADPGARNNRALCLTHLRDLPTAVEEMRAVVKILPNRELYRENLALYSAYSSDFAATEKVVLETPEPGKFALMARAFAELGQGQRSKARDTYQAVGKIDDEGASYMTSGLADIAVLEGRFSEAERILSQGAAADLTGKSPDKAAIKFAALAYVQLMRQQKSAAIASADKALANSQEAKIRFLAGRIYIEAGVPAKATKIAEELSGDLQVLSQNYGLILEGLRAMVEGKDRVAVEKLIEANTKVDTWIGHFDLGRAYMAAKANAQADSEFDRCITRSGEAVSLFLDEWPTYGYFPMALYYQGRVREAMGDRTFADSYKAYLDLRGASTDDPLVREVRKRAGG